MTLIYLCRDINIPDEYKINYRAEQNSLNKILTVFIEFADSIYFSDALDFGFKLSRLSENEYFIYLLSWFLKENELDKNSLFFHKYRIDMYDIELLSYNENGCEDYIYKLTDFSTTYQKLLLFTYLYEENNSSFKRLYPKISNYRKSDSIKDILDKKQIDVMRR